MFDARDCLRFAITLLRLSTEQCLALLVQQPLLAQWFSTGRSFAVNDPVFGTVCDARLYVICCNVTLPDVTVTTWKSE